LRGWSGFVGLQAPDWNARFDLRELARWNGMRRPRNGHTAKVSHLAVGLALGAACASGVPPPRPFPDRPVAWHEHDDAPVAKAPAPSSIGRQRVALLLRDGVTREAQRHLSLEQPRPAADVNALDEVPCSTWFCPRHHLHPLSPAEVAAGAPSSLPPERPLTIVAGKPPGAAAGAQVVDARGRKFLLKFDPRGYPRLASGAEVVGNRLLHAAGYNVPGAFVFDVEASDLLIAPDATYKLSDVAERPFTRRELDAMLSWAARDGRGRFAAVAVPWLPGTIIGGFDLIGRREDDPNDRIPHQDRR
jgi:hypothetical protein